MDDLKKEIPHIIVLAVLVFILLFVVTKFKWVHCSQVPGDWCSVYCSVAGRSRIAIIEGEGGIGDPLELRRQITRERFNTYPETIPMEALSAGVLKNYELVIVEGAKRITPIQVNAIRDYASSGGSVLWLGDSGTEHYLSPRDLDDALYRNTSSPGYYEAVVRRINNTNGFGDTISSLLQVNYQRLEEGDNLTLRIISKDHPITKGLKPEFTISAIQAGLVNPNSPSSSVLAYYYGTPSCTQQKPCAAIIANRFAAPVAYIAFPLEEGNSKSLITNAMDFLVTC